LLEKEASMAADILDSPVFEAILQRYVTLAEQKFKQILTQEGKVLTGDLRDSIRASAIEAGAGFIQGHIYFSSLLRIKDMRQLNYTRMPPFLAMLEYVEKVGPDKFPRVPGYPVGMRPASYTDTVERIAGGLMRKFKREPNVRRGYRGVYNDPLKNDILPAFFTDLRTHAGQTAMEAISLNLKD